MSDVTISFDGAKGCEVAVLRLEPNDTLLIRTPPLTPKQINHMRDSIMKRLQPNFPKGVEVVILPADFKVEVIKAAR